MKSQNNSNFITIEQQAEESAIDGEAHNETIAKEMNISTEVNYLLTPSLINQTKPREKEVEHII